MPNDEIAAAHRRLVEQVMSDERLLGLLPDNLSTILLNRTIARLDAAAVTATSAAELEAKADTIRSQARRVAAAAADAGDDESALTARLDELAPPVAREVTPSQVGAASTGDGGVPRGSSVARPPPPAPERSEEPTVAVVAAPGDVTVSSSSATDRRRSPDSNPGAAVAQGGESEPSPPINTAPNTSQQRTEGSLSGSLRHTLRRLRSSFGWERQR